MMTLQRSLTIGFIILGIGAIDIFLDVSPFQWQFYAYTFPFCLIWTILVIKLTKLISGN